MQYRTTVSAVIFNEKGEVLLCKQPNGRGVFPGQWAIPGGGMDEGETMVESLKRELREEIGIEIENIEPLHFSDDTKPKYRDGEKIGEIYMIYLRFTAKAKSTQIHLNEEHDEYVWVSLGEVDSYDLNEPTRDTFKKLGVVQNKEEIHKEWVKYPTGKIPTGAFCDCCKRYNVRNSTVQMIPIKDGKILLQKRNLNPEKGSWALVAGYVGWNETVEECMERELMEEVGLKAKNLETVGICSDPKRDKDGRQNIAVVFAGEVDGKLEIDPYEVEEAKWFDLDYLPDNIAFDHREMIEDYVEMAYGGTCHNCSGECRHE